MRYNMFFQEVVNKEREFNGTLKFAARVLAKKFGTSAAIMEWVIVDTAVTSAITSKGVCKLLWKIAKNPLHNNALDVTSLSIYIKFIQTYANRGMRHKCILKALILPTKL